MELQDSHRNIVCRLLAVSLAVLLVACARGLNERAPPTDQLLSATGFQMRSADTPRELDELTRMTQRRLVPHQCMSARYYVYADATLCRCLYVGSESALERFQRLAWYRRLDRSQRVAAESGSGAAMDWELWGPWDSGSCPQHSG